MYLNGAITNRGVASAEERELEAVLIRGPFPPLSLTFDSSVSPLDHDISDPTSINCMSVISTTDNGFKLRTALTVSLRSSAWLAMKLPRRLSSILAYRANKRTS
jgi:hypothetical protein